MGPIPSQSTFLDGLNLESGVSRRRFMAFAAAAPAILAPEAWGGPRNFWSMPRFLWLERRTPAGLETFRGVYFADGALIPKAYAEICYILRDVRAGQMIAMSPVLLDILCGVQGIAHSQQVIQPLHTTSGYRTHGTNTSIEGAAKNSLHTEGRAWDGRFIGYSAASLGEVAKYLRGGGVGIYPGRNFTHIDDGRLRSWQG